ncbi:hypothetical protein K8640_13025 [Myxococcus sp. XM-1-1-1]|nr:hypothetical protein [Myxococcus sp. XM-1-1-1]
MGLNSCNVERRECVLDVSSLVAIQPSQATISAQDPNDNLDWDVDGSAPDVVVELRCPTSVAGEPLVTRTPEISSWTPQWSTGGCSTSAEVLLAQPIEFKVLDIDTLLDDEIGTIKHQLTQDELKAGTVSLSLPPAITSLTVTLSRAR